MKRVQTPSLKQVAAEAGVSLATASQILRGTDESSTDTRKHVLEVAKRLRYRPNLLVRGMQTGQSFIVGLIIASDDMFLATIARGVHDRLIQSNYVPIQLWVKGPRNEVGEEELAQIHRLVDRRVDGVILWPSDDTVPDLYFRELWQRRVPLVTVDRQTMTHADHVGTDDECGGRLAAEHLLSLGHRHVAQFAGNPKVVTYFKRRRAFSETIAAAGGTCLIRECDDAQLISTVARDILGHINEITAVFAGDDVFATAISIAAAQMGVRVPDHLSIIGYADIAVLRSIVPDLTTIHQDAHQTGTVAAQLVLDRIQSPSSTAEHKTILMRPELIVRSSTAAARPAGVRPC